MVLTTNQTEFCDIKCSKYHKWRRVVEINQVGFSIFRYLKDKKAVREKESEREKERKEKETDRNREMF